MYSVIVNMNNLGGVFAVAVVGGVVVGVADNGDDDGDYSHHLLIIIYIPFSWQSSVPETIYRLPGYCKALNRYP